LGGHAAINHGVVSNQSAKEEAFASHERGVPRKTSCKLEGERGAQEGEAWSKARRGRVERYHSSMASSEVYAQANDSGDNASKEIEMFSWRELTKRRRVPLPSRCLVLSWWTRKSSNGRMTSAFIPGL
jgi:hypothetical protein